MCIYQDVQNQIGSVGRDMVFRDQQILSADVVTAALRSKTWFTPGPVVESAIIVPLQCPCRAWRHL